MTGRVDAAETSNDQHSRHGERGSAVIELPFILGLIILPFALLVLQLPVWVERQAAATDAAAEVARLITINGDRASADASWLVAAIEASHGLPAGSLRYEVSGGRGPGEPVSVHVTVELPTLNVPVFGPLDHRSWTATHTERRPDFGSIEP